MANLSLHPAELAARGRAPGKVILFGEHAAVYGRPAIAAAIDRWVEVVLTSASGPALPAFEDEPLALAVTRAAELLGVDLRGLEVRIVSSLPRAMGLGSSAALSVALLRALAARSGHHLTTAETNAFAHEIEAVFHGTPSGVDNSAVAHGGTIRFRRQDSAHFEIRPVAVARDVPLVVALGRAQRQTKQTVAALRARWLADPAAYEQRFDEIGWLVDDAERALLRGDLDELALLMNTNHELLHGLGVSTDELEEMVTLARVNGAVGAKLTGGGGGGAILCLCPGSRDALIQAFARAGWAAFATEITNGGWRGDGRDDAEQGRHRGAVLS